MRMKEFIFSRPGDKQVDVGLLLMRVGIPAALFVRHGWEKVSGFNHMLAFQMDPLHIGVYPTMAFATLSDGICTLLIILGLFTRTAAAVIVISLSVVFVTMENALGIIPSSYHLTQSTPPPPSSADHVELTFIYLIFFLGIVFAGPGRYSLDRLLFWREDRNA